MKKNILIRQHDIRDCGAACLASVAAYYGLELPIARIRQLCHTDTRGTNALGLIQGLEQMGFHAKGVKASFENLPEAPLPTIAHVILKGQHQHYIVIYKIHKNSIEVMDPGLGKMETYTFESFSQIWTGVLILMEPNEYFEQKNEKIPLYQRFYHLVQPHKSILLQALIGAVFLYPFGIVYFYLYTKNYGLCAGRWQSSFIELAFIGDGLALNMSVFFRNDQVHPNSTNGAED